MANIKEELCGNVSLSLTVKEGDGILEQGQKVKLTGNHEVGKITTLGDTVFGYVMVPNKEDGGKTTVLTPGHKYSQEVSGAAYPVGSLLGVDAQGRSVKFTLGRASATITIVDYSAFDGAETFTVNGVVLTHTTDFAVATSNAVTALNLANAINAKVPGVKATVAAGVITVTALDAGLAGNAITLVTTATAEEATVSGATLTGGSENRPYAIAVEPAAGAAENRFVVWL